MRLLKRVTKKIVINMVSSAIISMVIPKQLIMCYYLYKYLQ